MLLSKSKFFSCFFKSILVILILIFCFYIAYGSYQKDYLSDKFIWWKVPSPLITETSEGRNMKYLSVKEIANRHLLLSTGYIQEIPALFQNTVWKLNPSRTALDKPCVRGLQYTAFVKVIQCSLRHRYLYLSSRLELTGRQTNWLFVCFLI